MSTITAVLEPEADGSIRLLLPEELRGSGRVKVTATVEMARETPQPRFGCLAGMISLAPDFDAPLDDFREYTR